MVFTFSFESFVDDIPLNLDCMDLFNFPFTADLRDILSPLEIYIVCITLEFLNCVKNESLIVY